MTKKQLAKALRLACKALAQKVGEGKGACPPGERGDKCPHIEAKFIPCYECHERHFKQKARE